MVILYATKYFGSRGEWNGWAHKHFSETKDDMIKDNYGPISILAVFSNVSETIIAMYGIF